MYHEEHQKAVACPPNNTSPLVRPKPPKMNTCSSTNEMMHTGITFRAQRTRVSSTHAMEAMNNPQNRHAVNQLNRHRRQPAPILKSEGIVVIDRRDRRGAK
jgi:hypothetical protein